MIPEGPAHSEGAPIHAARELLARSQDASAFAELFELLYAELHRLAQAQLRKQGAALTLGATTLVHEAYMRMIGHDHLDFSERAKFFAYASRVMRNLAIDYARSRRALKRGRHLALTLDEQIVSNDDSADAALTNLCDAINKLAELDATLAELVDLHFFGGLTFIEIAALRQVSERTVHRDWRKARLVLKHTLHDEQLVE